MDVSDKVLVNPLGAQTVFQLANDEQPVRLAKAEAADRKVTFLGRAIRRLRAGGRNGGFCRIGGGRAGGSKWWGILKRFWRIAGLFCDLI